MSEPRATYTVTEWNGCYNDSWQGVITPEAFAHPAKFARGLIRRIYQHMLDRGYTAPGDSVVDPFGGVGLGGLDAMTFGLHWVGCELEPRFVELGNANIDKWRRDLAMLNGTLGTARLLQGDSRRLVEVVGGGMAATISSPPYAETHVADREAAQLAAAGNARAIPDGADNGGIRYGSTPGQLGSMPSGDFDSVVASPPYETDVIRTRDAGNHEPNRQGAMKDGAHSFDAYGSTPGQLGSMPTGDYAAAVSSPPYADAINGSGEGPGARHDPIYHNGDNAYKASSANGYGEAAGNLGAMRGDGWAAAVSSPPFENNLPSHDDFCPPHDTGERLVINYETAYGSDPANIDNDTGETFWSAARQIVEQTYQVLRPGGYAAWVCKDFIRKGQRVPFSDQWEQLCAAVGFEPVERIAALLVEEHGDQLDIFGGVTARRKERKSFFRRLAEKKGSPRIDHEDVVIMRRPL